MVDKQRKKTVVAEVVTRSDSNKRKKEQKILEKPEKGARNDVDGKSISATLDYQSTWSIDPQNG